MADSAAGNPPGSDGDPMEGAVLIRTGRRAPRRGSGFTRVSIDDGSDATTSGASTNGHGHSAHVDPGFDDDVAVEVGGVAEPMAATVDTTLLRERLVRLHDLAGDELERRRAEADLEPASAAPVPVEQLSSFSREMPRLARGVPHAAAEALSAARVEELRHLVRSVSNFVARQMELSARHGRGETEADEFGFDVEWTESLLPFFRFLYEHYWRVRVTGLENVPGEGRALLVSNHAGVLPFDGAMIRTAIIAEHPQPRHARMLVVTGLSRCPSPTCCW